ncbi:hypothetical protein H8S90_10090 [Olivibacter sp. SDN3]|uniref:hypothetical protein n=1 Tax=Olivibacter sp. SDN3 TaxID=2764720 RepID=UPI001650F7C2|nr:hypothetical protein [Olivibacter sp. SDN3]QNL51890.1 hypothetical protein H8S90_10090 [Olivibacter sp. SDN3]
MLKFKTKSTTYNQANAFVIFIYRMVQLNEARNSKGYAFVFLKSVLKLKFTGAAKKAHEEGFYEEIVSHLKKWESRSYFINILVINDL